MCVNVSLPEVICIDLKVPKVKASVHGMFGNRDQEPKPIVHAILSGEFDKTTFLLYREAPPSGHDFWRVWTVGYWNAWFKKPKLINVNNNSSNQNFWSSHNLLSYTTDMASHDFTTISKWPARWPSDVMTPLGILVCSSDPTSEGRIEPGIRTRKGSAATLTVTF